MKRALFVSKNLLGDGLYIGPVAKRWHELHPDYSIDLLTIPNHAVQAYDYMQVPWRVLFEPQSPYDFEFCFDVDKAFAIASYRRCHLVEAYAAMLLVPGPFEKRPNYNPPYLGSHLCRYALISPFSMSCASRGNPPAPANKILPWQKWIAILDVLKMRGIAHTFIAQGTDPLPKDANAIIDCLEKPLGMVELTNIMRLSFGLITVDNGMVHLAASQNVPTFLLSPACLSTTYIAPVDNPNLRIQVMDPLTVDANSLSQEIDDWVKSCGEPRPDPAFPLDQKFSPDRAIS